MAAYGKSISESSARAAEYGKSISESSKAIKSSSAKTTDELKYQNKKMFGGDSDHE